ncbi:MAG: hypothetical protein QM758_26870 [Armatimonas sp.]
MMPDPGWRKMPLLSPEMKRAGILLGGEGSQWPRAITQSQSDPDFLLLGIDVGGIYRSLDGGKTWNQSLQGWQARGANDLAIHPTDSRRVLGVGGNSMDWQPGWNGGRYPHGVYLSSNKGETWQQTLSFPEGLGGRVAWGPGNLAYFLHPKTGLWLSQDGGRTWQSSKRKELEGAGVDSYLRIGTKGGVLIGGAQGLWRLSKGELTRLREKAVYGLDIAHSGALYVSDDDGVHVSRDGGATFTTLPEAGLTRQGKPIRNILVSPAREAYLACWVRGDNWQWVRYTSHDSGTTWQPIQITNTNCVLPNNVRDGFFVWHPKDPNTIFGVGGDTVTKSTDGGRTFRWSAAGYNGIMVGGLFNLSVHAPEVVFMAFQDYNGAFTIDGGQTWSYRDVSGKGWGGFCYGGHAVDKQTMYCGDAESWSGPRHLRITHDGGKTWSSVDGVVFHGSDVSYSDPRDRNILFASDWRSGDGGKTWQQMSGCHGVYCASSTALFGRRDRAIVQSLDHGLTWNPLAESPEDVRDIAVPPDGSSIYVAGVSRLLRLTEGKWTTVETPKDQYGNRNVVTVAVDPVRPEVLYVGGPANLYASSATICRSTNSGKTWENLTRGNGPHEVASIRVHPKTREAWVNGQCFGLWRLPAP